MKIMLTRYKILRGFHSSIFQCRNWFCFVFWPRFWAEQKIYIELELFMNGDRKTPIGNRIILSTSPVSEVLNQKICHCQAWRRRAKAKMGKLLSPDNTTCLNWWKCKLSRIGTFQNETTNIYKWRGGVQKKPKVKEIFDENLWRFRKNLSWWKLIMVCEEIEIENIGF